MTQEATSQLALHAQHGDGHAMEALWWMCQPLVNSIRRRFRERPLYEEFEGLAFVRLHELVLAFDVQSKLSFFRYVQRLLPLKIATDVARAETAANREQLWAERVSRYGGEVESTREGEDVALYEAARARGDPKVADGGVEEAALNRLLLAEALAKLTPYQRAVVLRRILEERSFEEIAVDLEKTAAACRQTFRDAVQKLRTELRKKMEDP